MTHDRNDGQDEEEDEARERDLPGQVDSQRGRAAYSAAEKAHDQYSERATATQKGREYNDSERELRLRFSEQLQNQYLTHQANLNSVTVMLLASAATSNDGGMATLVSALAEQMAKNAGNTPPVTVLPVKGA